MIFSIKIIKTIYNVLHILDYKKENYANMYRKIGISHETLQTTLKYLLNKNLIEKENKGHKKSFYKITKKGEEYFKLLIKLKEF